MKSMSGFASVTRDGETATVGVMIRALNHRFLDLQVRLPTALGALESRLRQHVQQTVSRGRVELNVSVRFRRPPIVDVALNEQVGRAVAESVAAARAQGLVAGDLTPGDLLRLPQVLSMTERAPEEDPQVAGDLERVVLEVVDTALEQLEEMRRTEGRHVADDLDRRRAGLADLVERIAAGAATGAAALRERLTERLQELVQDPQVDGVAVASEVVRFAARSDISEELARFRAHLEHWRALTGGEEPCGRKLDFLLQEMNREVNTMGAKADGLAVPELIVSAKAELEKMREQVQNVE